MELVYPINASEGKACALIASYAFPPGAVILSSLGENAMKSSNQLLRLHSPDGVITDPLTIIKYLCSKSESHSILLGSEKIPSYQAAVDQWLAFFASKSFQVSTDSDLNELNSALGQNTFLCGNCISAADLVGMTSVYISVKTASAKELQALKNLTRWYNHMQNLPGIKEHRVQDLLPIDLPVTSSKDIIEASKDLVKKNKDNAAGGKQKQQEQQRQQQQVDTDSKAMDNRSMRGKAEASKKDKAKDLHAVKTEERPIDDPMRLDMRVGLVKKVWRHPEADKLYCEEIDFGSLGQRKIASGLVPYLSKEEFEGKKVIVLFNLKAKALRGFDSHGMILCANAEDKSTVELLQPPDNAPLGERVVIQGMSGDADEVLSAKKGKDTLAAVSPFLKTKDDCIAYYKVCIDIMFPSCSGACIRSYASVTGSSPGYPSGCSAMQQCEGRIHLLDRQDRRSGTIHVSFVYTKMLAASRELDDYLAIAKECYIATESEESSAFDWCLDIWEEGERSVLVDKSSKRAASAAAFKETRRKRRRMRTEEERRVLSEGVPSDKENATNREEEKNKDLSWVAGLDINPSEAIELETYTQGVFEKMKRRMINVLSQCRQRASLSVGFFINSRSFSGRLRTYIDGKFIHIALVTYKSLHCVRTICSRLLFLCSNDPSISKRWDIQPRFMSLLRNSSNT